MVDCKQSFAKAEKLSLQCWQESRDVSQEEYSSRSSQQEVDMMDELGLQLTGYWGTPSQRWQVHGCQEEEEELPDQPLSSPALELTEKLNVTRQNELCMFKDLWKWKIPGHSTFQPQ